MEALWRIAHLAAQWAVDRDEPDPSKVVAYARELLDGPEAREVNGDRSMAHYNVTVNLVWNKDKTALRRAQVSISHPDGFVSVGAMAHKGVKS